jgi:hypothetical protein
LWRTIWQQRRNECYDRCVLWPLCLMTFVLWPLCYDLCLMTFVLWPLSYDLCVMTFVVWPLCLTFVLWPLCYDLCVMIFFLWPLSYGLCLTTFVLWPAFYDLRPMSGLPCSAYSSIAAVIRKSWCGIRNQIAISSIHTFSYINNTSLESILVHMRSKWGWQPPCSLPKKFEIFPSEFHNKERIRRCCCRRGKLRMQIWSCFNLLPDTEIFRYPFLLTISARGRQTIRLPWGCWRGHVERHEFKSYCVRLILWRKVP